jgi:hypothetical protein
LRANVEGRADVGELLYMSSTLDSATVLFMWHRAVCVVLALNAVVLADRGKRTVSRRLGAPHVFGLSLLSLGRGVVRVEWVSG